MTAPLWTLQEVRLGPAARPRLMVTAASIGSGVTAVIGESGAGKTSLLNLLVGFELPDAGRVEFSPPGTSPLPRAWVPGDAGLWPHLSVREHVRSVTPVPGPPNWLEAFDLADVAGQRPETLSMGERSRLAVARSLASGAAVHVMDEPLVHVDAARRDRYWRVIRETLQQQNGSLVFATHSPEEVLCEAERVICIADGRIVWEGEVLSLYDDPPDLRTARFLGPVNWFDPEESGHWFDGTAPQPRCLRPEQLTLTPVDDGRFVVSETRFAGSLAATDVRDTIRETTRTFYHRPAMQRVAPGMPVALHVILTCLLVFVLLILPGCGPAVGEEPRLKIGVSTHVSLPAEGAMLPAPRGMTFSPEGELYVLDTAGRVIVYDADGSQARRWWMPRYEIGRPEGAWVLLDGRIAVADTHYHRVLFFSSQGSVLGELGEFGYDDGQFIYTVAVTQDTGGFLYVAEYGGNDRIQKFTANGEHVVTFGAMGTDSGEFQRPSGIVWHEGIVYVADAINNRVQAFRDDGTFLSIVADAESAGLYYPYDLSLGPDGTLYAVEYGAGRITRLSLAGEVLGRYGKEGRGLGELWTPWGIAVSSTGSIAVADTGNRRVVLLKP